MSLRSNKSKLYSLAVSSLVVGCYFIIPSAIYAQNPITPPGMSMADPSAHVWKDGKLYIYGSRDESPRYFCSHSEDVLVTEDFKYWTVVKDVFASAGSNDQVPYSDAKLFAPDCQYRKGTYYFYYCLADTSRNEGFATSPSPSGPFMNGTDINLHGIGGIDPCVFVDDDGQAYYIWGQFNAKVAKLKPDMMEIDSSSIHDSVVTEKEHFFHEGGYMVKRKGIYYFIYSHMGRAGMPTCIGYSMAKSPFGPFKYGGVIIDNNHCDPHTWNDHGCLVEFHNQWFVFYHRSTANSVSMRKTCVEPITFRADGTIPEVEMTTQGTSGPLPATDKLEAERACLLYGNVYIGPIAADNEALMGIHPDDRVSYKYLDFGDGVDSVTIAVSPGARPGRIDLVLDQLWHPSIGTIEVPGNGNGKSWTTITVPVNHPKGVHALILSFSGEGVDCFKIDWLRFSKAHSIAERTIVLTFDDACASHYHLVAPLLKKYGFGATFYVCEFPHMFGDTTLSMNWQQIKALSDMGFEIGNHTWHHTNIDKITSGQFEKELTYIEKKCDSLGMPKPLSFAYPAYHTDSTKLSILLAHGYLTARGGGDKFFDIRKDDRMNIPSFALSGEDSNYFYRALDQVGENKVIVFTIHGVPDIAHPWASLPSAMLERYLQYLYDHHYRVIAMRDVVSVNLLK
jgi:arabinoxylan arabinofuranohydrolase